MYVTVYVCKFEYKIRHWILSKKVDSFLFPNTCQGFDHLSSTFQHYQKKHVRPISETKATDPPGSHVSHLNVAVPPMTCQELQESSGQQRFTHFQTVTFFILHLATKIKDGRCLVRTHMIHVVAKVLYKFCINFTLTGLPYFIQHPAHRLGLDHLSSLSDR